MLCFHANVVKMCADMTAVICLNLLWRFVAIALTPRTFLNDEGPVSMDNLAICVDVAGLQCEMKEIY